MSLRIGKQNFRFSHQTRYTICMTASELHTTLARQGIRLFALHLRRGGHTEDIYWIHPAKTVLEWRGDVRAFYQSTIVKVEKPDQPAGFTIIGRLRSHLESLGYIEIEDVIADIFEGEVTNEQSRIIDWPIHDDQPDGFGHFGCESKLGTQE